MCRVFMVIKIDNYEHEQNYDVWLFHKLKDAKTKMENVVKEVKKQASDNYEYENHSSETLFEMWRKGEHVLDNVLVRIHELEVL